MLNVCITFDYEIFFGKSKYSIEEVLIDPTNRILDILEKMNVKATFFVDAPMCIKFRNNGDYDIADKIDRQMIEMVMKGHDVQLHVHPAWYKAKRKDSEWVFDNAYYSINSFKNDEHGIYDIIYETKDYLSKLLNNTYPDYNCIAYRAGGFCIQPEEYILSALKDNNIFVDSSVCKQLYAHTSSHQYDFCDAPCDYHWRFNADSGLLCKDNKGEFIEIPIGSEYRIPQKWISVHGSPRLKREELKGETSFDTDKKRNRLDLFFNKIKDFMKQGIMMSLDSSHYIALCKMISNYVSCHSCDKEEQYIAMIGHPKLFCEENYLNMMRFIESIQRDYSRIISFCTITDAYQSLKKETYKND